MEDSFVIVGGNKISGEVKLSGAKNVALKLIIAALMFDQEVILKNIPKILDVFELLNLIKYLGGRAEFIEENTVAIDSRNLNNNRVDLLHSSKIRVSFMMFAPLLKKFSSCYVPNPGGCRIGARPIDRVIEGMQKLGIEVEYDHQNGYYFAKNTNITNNSYTFSKPSHTGTELLILISLIKNSKTILDNCALEPEIDDLINFLNKSGAQISREGRKIIIVPASKLVQKDAYTIVSDRNEAITYASLAIATKGEIIISHISKNLINTYLNKLSQIGVGIKAYSDSEFKIFYQGALKSLNIETSPHPGFMTDWQPNWAILMTQATGNTIIHERVFENRFSYVEELRKLGANIDFVKVPVVDPMEYFFFNFDPAKKYNQAIRIHGNQQLHGGALNITDLRAGATLAIAALVADGESVINNASILERGYEKFVEKITKLGGNIRKI